MRKIKEFCIKLDNMTGKKVSSKVIVVLEDCVKMHGLRLEVYEEYMLNRIVINANTVHW